MPSFHVDNHIISPFIWYAEYRKSSPYYDEDYYRKEQKNLKNFDSKSLLKHYITYGLYENKAANTKVYILPIKYLYNGNIDEIAHLCFNARYYADTYSDLKKAYGYNEANLRNHWVTYEINEKRYGNTIRFTGTRKMSEENLSSVAPVPLLSLDYHCSPHGLALY